MTDLELARKIAAIYGAQWGTDETKLEQLRLLRERVLVPMLLDAISVGDKAGLLKLLGASGQSGLMA